ncbi:hypothetical protein ABAC460_13080 [Asticcacaulis sp. AC460]|uniref:MFS transporter n=1 Tax=Asticcacaulis sp. AC460 TaxID=1282360 RepID=UPI0003C40A52|nr:MFS transporter [Asticcacaulis sp. AC460]ESQ89224.1 hypothetical protein ABAC460_13080 [Asticcacaulis sp. AC460]
MPEVGDRVYRKVWLRLVLLLTVLIVLSSIDRVNVSFAALHMNGDLGIDKVAYGQGVSLFFAGYLLFQFPSIWLFRKFGMRLWAGVTVIAWGAVAAAMAFIHTKEQFFALRFLLGVAESGFAPGVVAFLSQWMPQAYRGRALGFTLLAVPTSVIIGGPVSGLLMQLDWLDLPGWRWMYFLEGLPTILLGLFALVWLTDRADKARWLDADEKAWIAAEIGRERAEAGPKADLPVVKLILQPRLWALAALWFALLTGSNALIFWLPQTLKSLTGFDAVTIGWISALPWLGLGLGMFVNARLSDRAQERIWHSAIPAVAAAVFLAIAISTGAGPLALTCLVLGAVGLGAAQSVFWTLPARLFAGSPFAITTINLCGNLSGVLTPLAIGAILQQSGSVHLVVFAVAAILVAGAGLLVTVVASQMRHPVKT